MKLFVLLFLKTIFFINYIVCSDRPQSLNIPQPLNTHVILMECLLEEFKKELQNYHQTRDRLSDALEKAHIAYTQAFVSDSLPEVFRLNKEYQDKLEEITRFSRQYRRFSRLSEILVYTDPRTKTREQRDLARLVNKGRRAYQGRKGGL